MTHMLLRPLSIGRILDRSFQLYRKHFVKLTLIMLILYGPFYLLQHLILYNDSPSPSSTLLDQIRSGGSIRDILENGAGLSQSPDLEIWQGLVFGLILVPIFVIGLMPASIASVVHMVKAVLLGEEEPSVGDLLKRSFRRFWPLAGSTVLVALIMIGIYMGLAIGLLLLGVVFTFGAGISSAVGGAGAGMGISIIIFFILAFFGFFVLLFFFCIRWGYYLPFVALQEDSIGIGRSWNLTKRSFWRLFLMYFVLMIILYLFMLVIGLLIQAIAGAGIISQLLQSLVSVLISPLWILPYAISFFDLKVRNEGLGLEAMIGHASNDAPIVPSVPENREEYDTRDDRETADDRQEAKDPLPEDSDKKHE